MEACESRPPGRAPQSQAGPTAAPRPPLELPNLLDLQPYAPTRRTYVCKRCSRRFLSAVNQQRCACLSVTLPRAPRAPVALDIRAHTHQPWQRAHISAFQNWWLGLSSTDAANVLNMALDGAIGSQICSWWGLSAFGYTNSCLSTLAGMSELAGVLALASALRVHTGVLVGGATRFDCVRQARVL